MGALSRLLVSEESGRAVKQRFTLDGSPALEARIGQDMALICETALSAAGSTNLDAIILGGGYGRGEGGVLREENEERPYNDYDFFVVTPHAARRKRLALQHALAEAGESLYPQVGVHVDFGPPLPRARLSELPYELMLMELKAGHRVIYGSPAILDAMPAYDSSAVPLQEGARLLMNRGVGLLLSRQKLRGEEGRLPDDDTAFVVRNIQKAAMALGDVVLMCEKRYAPSYVERLRRFAEADLSGYPQADVLRQRYAESIEFKLRPRHVWPPETTLSGWLEETIRLYGAIHLEFERHRLGIQDMTWEAYAALPTRLGAHTLSERIANLARNMRSKNAAAAHGLRDAFLHPRDHLFARLPALLHGERPRREDEDAYLRLWSVYN